MLSETLSRLGNAGLLDDQQFKDKSHRQIAEDLLAGRKKDVMKGSQAASIIEFGRAVHAEMAAICDAAQRGISIKTLHFTAPHFRAIFAPGISWHPASSA
jgi:cytidine deaminase